MKKILLTPNPYRDKDFNTVRSAMQILQQAGADLAVLVRLLVERAPTTDALPLCCSGSLLTKNAIVRAAFETALHAAALPISSVFDLQEPTRGVLSLYKTTT